MSVIDDILRGTLSGDDTIEGKSFMAIKSKSCNFLKEIKKNTIKPEWDVALSQINEACLDIIGSERKHSVVKTAIISIGDAISEIITINANTPAGEQDGETERNLLIFYLQIAQAFKDKDVLKHANKLAQSK
ncbi:MAG: hypothetical protein OEX08_03325 [Candidatus Nomurabacteria bacterium]|nr:hypothetical protein [Candidatus Nomurabacteria bacterium]